MSNMDLFEDKESVVLQVVGFSALESPEARASRRIREVLLEGHPLVFAYSSGKDSGTLVGIGLNVCRELISGGFECPPVFCLHGDTLVTGEIDGKVIESPEIQIHAREEIAKMEIYAKKHGITLKTKITTPDIATSWPVRVIGGRALPAFPDSRSDCSTDWKVLPNQRGQKELIAEIESMNRWNTPVVLTGVRNNESNKRDQNIAKRGEQAEGIWFNDFGAARLSPLLDWTEDDIWEFIGLCNAGVIEAFSAYEETMRIYRDAGGSSCVVVADMKAAANTKPCGTRTGCWACTRVAEDKSMAQMIVSDPKRYAHLKPLADLRDFISNTQYDWSRRQYVGRSIDDEGYIAIGADTYSPDMLAKLLRYTLSAQRKSGVQIISMAQLIAIDARWSQYALHPPFTALRIYNEVMDGHWEFAPKVERFRKTDVPKIGKIFVGSASFNGAQTGYVSGLRDVSMEVFHESCGYELKSLKDGTTVCDLESDEKLVVDEEAAMDFLQFFGDEMIERYCSLECSDWTYGFKTYLQFGTVEVGKGRSSQTHEILQRSQWRQLNGLHGQVDLKTLEARCDILFSSQLELC